MEPAQYYWDERFMNPHHDRGRENQSRVSLLAATATSADDSASPWPFDCAEKQLSSSFAFTKLPPSSSYSSSPSDMAEIRDFESNLFWLGLRFTSTLRGTALSCLVFFVFAVLVPVLNIICVKCRDCDEIHKHPFEKVVQLSESVLAAIAFFSLLFMLREHGVSEVLLLNDIGKDSEYVQQAYKQHIRGAFRLLVRIMLPCLIIELVHKIVWFVDASVEIPVIEDDLVKKIFLCSAIIVAWFYRTSIFLFMCILFRLMCMLQILRLQSHYKLLEESPPVFIILQDHMCLRDKLFIISHRFRKFILLSFFTITLSQFASLFQVTATSGSVSFERLGDLSVCSAVQVIGLIFCFHGAAKITHRAQRIVAIVSQWHAIATCLDDAVLGSSSSSSSSLNTILNAAIGRFTRPMIKSDSDGDLATSLHIFHCTKDSIGDSYSFQKRNALVTYLRHCSTGISIYGFLLDRGLLYTIFALELSLILWTLGKTITMIN